MVIRPTKAEYKQYEELKKKIENYEQRKIEMIDMLEDLFRDVKDAILHDRVVTILKTMPSFSSGGQVTQLTITVGG